MNSLKNKANGATPIRANRLATSPPPHAVFSYPQVAGVGLTEQAARKGHKIEGFVKPMRVL